MNNIEVMANVVRKKLDKKLKFLGLQISGGSYDWSTETWWIGLDKGASATYDQHRVAELLFKCLDVQRIVLDGICFTKSELNERKRVLQSMISMRTNKQRIPKETLA